MLGRASTTTFVATTIDAIAADENANRNATVHISRRGSGAAFGGDQVPVWIARRDLSGKSPDVGDIADRVRAPVDHIAVAIACRRYQLRNKAERELRHFATQVRVRDLG